MKKALKWLSYLLLSVVVAVILIITTAYVKRDEILKEINTALNNEVNGTFQIASLDFTFFHNFPNFSLTLHDVYLKDVRYDSTHHNVFEVEKLFLDVGLMAFLKREISIDALSLESGAFFIYRGMDGYSNLDALKLHEVDSLHQIPARDAPLLFRVEALRFKDVDVVYIDSLKSKAVGFTFIDTSTKIAREDSSYHLYMKGLVHADKLMLNASSGSYLADKDVMVKFHMVLHDELKMLIIESSTLQFERFQLGLSGAFELKREGHFQLTFETDALNLTEAKPILNRKINYSLRKLSIETPLKVKVTVNGISRQGYKPAIDIAFQSDHAFMRYGKINLTNVTLAGTFTNHLDSTQINDNDNSSLALSSFKGTINNLPLKGHAVFTKLKDPLVELTLSSALNFTDLNREMDTTRIAFKRGKFRIDLSYQGKISEFMDSSRTAYEGKLKGKIIATNATLLFNPRKILLSTINLDADFNERALTLNNLSLDLAGKPVQIKGSIRDFIPFFISPKDKGYIQLSVFSPHLDLTPFAATGRKKTEIQKTLAHKRMTALFDKLYEKLEFKLDVKASQLTFRKFEARDFTGDISLVKSKLVASPVKMKLAKGSVKLSFVISELFKDNSPMSFTADVDNAEIKNFFISFDNFNQQAIHSDNLSGNISAQVEFNAVVDNEYHIIPSSMQGELNCKITNGVLKEFQPLMNMSNFLFKERNFAAVEFAEINSRFSIRGPSVEIGRMEVQSSVLSLFLQGYYSFRDSTTLSVQIPLSNLKRGLKNYKPENIGNDAKVGPSVFLHVYRGHDINGKLVIAYDPFKKWVRKNK